MTNTSIVAEKLSGFDRLVEQGGLHKKPHQRIGVEWMLERELAKAPLQGVRGGLIADEMGLGKTVLVIGTIFANFKNRTLIVLPLALLNQWSSQFQRFTGHNPLVYHGMAKKDITIEQLIAAPIVLTTYGNCLTGTNKDSEHIDKNILHRIPWDRVVFDEAHHLRNEMTRAHKGAVQIQAPIRWLVTGTPIQNRRADFFALCHVMGYSKEYYMDSDNLMDIARWSMLKRTKEQVGIQLPAVKEENVEVKWANRDESMLAEDIHGMLSFADVRSERQTNAAVAAMSSSVLPTLIRCRQSCVLPGLMKGSIQKLDRAGLLDSSEYDIKAATSSSSKLDAVCEKIIGRKDNGRGKLVFCHFRGEIDLLASRLREADMNVETFDGRTNLSRRQEILNNEGLDVLILQIKTGSEGLNLQHFKEIYFVSPHWNPAIEDQAVARCHRIGQENEVDIFRFTMAGFDNEGSRSLDRYASEVQDAKRQIYNITDEVSSEEK